MELTEEEITKLKVDYVHDLLKIIERQDFQVYAVKLGRLNEIQRKLQANGKNAKVIVEIEDIPVTESHFEEKELRHLTDKDL